MPQEAQRHFYLRRNPMAEPTKERKSDSPPLIRLRSPQGIAIYPRMVRQPDGSWEIKNPEELKKLLQINLKDLK
jgi:hypothetical protein